MRVAIAGAGNVGWFIARELVANDHDVLLLEKVPEVAARWGSREVKGRVLRPDTTG